MTPREYEEFEKVEELSPEVLEADPYRLRDDEAPLELEGDYEPVPVSKDPFPRLYSGPLPFGSPPDEPVAIVGEVPWELREDEPGGA